MLCSFGVQFYRKKTDCKDSLIKGALQMSMMFSKQEGLCLVGGFRAFVFVCLMESFKSLVSSLFNQTLSRLTLLGAGYEVTSLAIYWRFSEFAESIFEDAIGDLAAPDRLYCE